jgi:hypothetical protein
MTVKLDGPIPGQSLTREVGNSPWEQPPLYADNQQALTWHMNNIGKEKNMDQLLFLLDQGFPLSTFVDSLTTTAVMNGYHTVDTSTLISPVLHEYIKEVAGAAGVNLKEWDGPSEEEKAAEVEKQRLTIALGNKLSQPPEQMAAPTVTEQPASPPKGIINRRQ